MHQSSPRSIPLTEGGSYDLAAFRAILGPRGACAENRGESGSLDCVSHSAASLRGPIPFPEAQAHGPGHPSQVNHSIERAVVGLEHLVAPDTHRGTQQAHRISTAGSTSPSMTIGGVGGPSLPPGYGEFSAAGRRRTVPPVIGVSGVDLDPPALREQRILAQQFDYQYPDSAKVLNERDRALLAQFHTSLLGQGLEDAATRSLVQQASGFITNARRRGTNTQVDLIRYNSDGQTASVSFFA